jgi:hypothetical protein
MQGNMIGLDPTAIAAATAVPAFRLGTYGAYEHPTKGTQVFVYGRASGAVTAAGYVCVELTGFDFDMCTVTVTTAGTAGFGSRVGVAQAALADNEYGWFQVAGKGSVRTLASAAKGTRLNSTATEGALDDDAGAGSEAIFGIVLGTATGGAEATNTDALLSFPTVGTTL